MTRLSHYQFSLEEPDLSQQHSLKTGAAERICAILDQNQNRIDMTTTKELIDLHKKAIHHLTNRLHHLSQKNDFNESDRNHKRKRINEETKEYLTVMRRLWTRTQQEVKPE